MDDHFDIAIIGMGCAGCHVVLELLNQNYAGRVVIVDDYKAESLDKTWSFWEKGSGPWDHLVNAAWQNGVFKSKKNYLKLNLGDYSYKSIPSKDFINYTISQISKSKSFTYLNSHVVDLKSKDKLYTLLTKNENITSTIVLDSRVSPQFQNDTSSTTLLQHFKGWVIETDYDTF
ncbi:MAG: lycopene cyclase family protein, partial [Nonlabens sp.]